MVKPRNPHRLQLTAEMVELFRRGRELQAEGYDDVDAEGPKRDEFIAIDKKLCWRVLRRDLHMVSIFENLDGPAPAYMEKRNSPAHPDFNGWYSGRRLQTALQAALEGRK